MRKDLIIEQKHALARVGDTGTDQITLSIMKKVIAVFTVIHLDRFEVEKLRDWLTQWLEEN